MKSSRFNFKAVLYGGSGIIMVSFMIIIAVSYFSMEKVIRLHQSLRMSYEANHNLAEIRANRNRNHALLYKIILCDDAKEKENIQHELQAQSAHNDSIIASIAAYYINDPVNASKVAEIQNNLANYRSTRNQLFDLAKEGKKNEAIQLLNTSGSGFYEAFQKGFIELDKSEDIASKKLIRLSDSFATESVWLVLIVGIAATLMCFIMVVIIIVLIRSLTREINEGITILGTSTAEILTTSTEVSTGATETATAVAETTTTVEEVRQTAQLSSQKANSVLESAQKATSVSAEGKKAVEETIEGMNRIDRQMNLVSDSVIRLSEQSRSIGEITATVNDLADQSNLLAVNAAIEAAKAGDQGRGFTIVAQEIRSLAEQSKQATTQVREILNEIQKSVNQAVMATEQGMRAVETGKKLAAQSGDVIELLAESVGDAAQSAMQISSSSQQQMAGMNQIVPAMENIRQASEQNVIGTKQTQVAANNLNDLGKNLKAIAEKFKA